MAQWNVRANEVFALALEVPQQRRQLYLERACGDDSELRGQVEALLAAYARAGDFLDWPSASKEYPSPSTASEHADSAPPHASGPEEWPARYEMEGEIARGGMGRVLRGRDTAMGREIAVKVLLEAHQGRAEMEQRFVEEARIAGQLQHPGVAPVYDLGALPGQRPYFTMKLVKGQTLAALLRQRQDSGQELPRLVGIFEAVCQAVAYAHSKRVIHRDLKPANVMVGSFGEVQVMDWGLAKVLDHEEEEATSVIHSGRLSGESGSGTQAGSVLGTPAYMAPEQARGELEDVDERADVFGLGSILCEMLTGQPPFAGKNSEALRLARQADLSGAFARLAACPADGDLIELCRRCLVANPDERPRDGTEVAAAVTDYQYAVSQRLRRAELARAAEEARAIEAQATAEQERKARQQAQAREAAERRSRRLMLALASLVLLAVLGAGGTWLGLHTRQEARLAENTRAVNEALTEAAALRERAQATRGREAAGLAARARERAQRAAALAEGGPVEEELAARVRELLAELDEEDSDRQLLDALEKARLAQTEANMRENRFNYEQALPLFREAFRAYGLPAGQGEATRVAEQLNRRPAAVREAVLAALDEWVVLAESQYLPVVRPNGTGLPGEGPRRKVEEPDLAWLRNVLAALEPGGWGRRLRDTAAEKDPARRRAALQRLADSAAVKRLPARAVVNLAKRLWRLGAGSGAIALLRRAQPEHPDDFWVNQTLGTLLLVESPAAPAEAARYLTAALALRPDSAGAQLNLGNALKAQRKWGEAIACYGKAIEIQPKYTAAYYNLGNALEGLGSFEEAIAAHRRAIELGPRFAAVHASLGNALWNQGKREEAVAEFHKAIELDPKYATAHHNLGVALEKQGKRAEAIRHFRVAIQNDAHYASAYFRLGNLYDAKQDYEAASAAFRKAITLAPKDAEAHNNLGNALFHQGKREEAIAAFRKAIALDPKLANAHNGLGVVLLNLGKLEEAVGAYKKAIQLNPTFAPAHNNLGDALFKQGKLKEAETAFRQAIKLDPKDAEAHTNLGVALAAQGKHKEAIAAYKKAVQIDTKNARAHYHVGTALAQQGKHSEAEAAFRKVIQLDPRNASAHHNLGKVLFEQGKRKEAIAAYGKAIGNYRRLPQAHLNHGDGLLRPGKHSEAATALRKAGDLPGGVTWPVRLELPGPTGVAWRTQTPSDWSCLVPNREDGPDGYLPGSSSPTDAVALDGLTSSTAVPGVVSTGAPGVEFNQLPGGGDGLFSDEAPEETGKIGPETTRMSPKPITASRNAVRLAPTNAPAHYYLGTALARQGKLKEAETALRKAVELDPGNADAYHNLGNALREQGKHSEAETAFRKATDLDPKSASAHFNLGLALQDQGKLEEAVASYRRAIERDPKFADVHGALGEALLQQGRFAAARGCTQRCLNLLDENHPLRATVLRQRRRCDRLFEQERKLPGVLAGDFLPGASELLKYASLCALKKWHSSAARLYAQAFDAQPSLASDLTSQARYDAARSAARAAAGRARDARLLPDKVTLRLRRQALAWLRAELDAYARLVEGGNALSRAMVAQRLRSWQQHTDLAALRDAVALGRWPADERAAWRQLWADVQALLQRASDKR
jgi:serine/threonine-protein kinase